MKTPAIPLLVLVPVLGVLPDTAAVSFSPPRVSSSPPRVSSSPPRVSFSPPREDLPGRIGFQGRMAKVRTSDHGRINRPLEKHYMQSVMAEAR